MRSAQIIPKLKRSLATKEERRQTAAWIFIVALCSGALWIGAQSEPLAGNAAAPAATARLSQNWLSQPVARPEASVVLRAQSPLTFNQFMGLLKKETPKPLAAKVAENFMKEPALADAIHEFTGTPEAGERPASEFLSRVASLPEFHGFLGGFGGSSSAQSTFQRIAAIPQVDSVLSAFATRTNSTLQRGGGGSRSARTAFSDAKGAGKTSAANLANREQQGVGTGITAVAPVPPVGAWKEVATAGPAAGAIRTIGSEAGQIGGGLALFGESGPQFVGPGSPGKKDEKTISIKPPPESSAAKKEEEEKKSPSSSLWKNLLGAAVMGTLGAVAGFAVGGPAGAIIGAGAGIVVGSKEGPIAIDAIGGAAQVVFGAVGDAAHATFDWLTKPF